MAGNPLFRNGFGQMQTPTSGMMGVMQQFNQFRSNFHGDPRQKVEELLASGQMTQEQFQQLSAMAKQFQLMFGRK